MSIRELAWRGCRFLKANLRRLTNNEVDLEKVLRSSHKKNTFYFNKDDRDEFLRLFPDAINGIVSRAEALCRHEFMIFDLKRSTGKEIDWHRDIVTNQRWPLKYWADIDFRNNNGGRDIRFVWEFNRHQHLVTLAKACFLTKKKKYAKEAKNEIFSWIRQNPRYMGVNWASPLEVSLRLISWCWAYKFIEPLRAFTEGEKREFLKSVHTQAEFIEDNLSGYSSANNHLIGESCGLVVAGITFPEFKDSEKWFEKGRSILFGEILKQTYSDGVTREQAFAYQGFVTELFLVAAALLIKNGMEIPEDVSDRVYAMAEFVMNIMAADGSVPNVGDSDNGKAVVLSDNKDFNVFKSILTSVSILSGRGDFKKKGSVFQEEHYWLFGKEGFDKYSSTKNKKVNLRSRFFEKGGYAVLRNKRDVFLMDCGELGYGSIAAHAHADSLSITLSSNGVRLLIDPGTYLYHGEPSWRKYFRSTSSHNTIRVNKRDQSDMTGPFIWGKRVVPRIETWQSSPERDYVSASYSNCRVSHRRSISFNKKRGVYRIEDFVDAKPMTIVEQYFHLAPDSVVHKFDGNIIKIRNRNIFLYMAIDSSFSVDVKEGIESPIIGWSSDMFGAKKKSPTLVNTALIEDRDRFDTFLYVSKRRLGPGRIKDIFDSVRIDKGSTS